MASDSSHFTDLTKNTEKKKITRKKNPNHFSLNVVVGAVVVVASVVVVVV
jgi:hypothetical protein